MKRFRRNKEPLNPDGLTIEEFKATHPEAEDIMRICWFFGIEPEDFAEQIKCLIQKGEQTE